MAIRSPSTETIRVITKILMARTTSLAELPLLIANIDHAVESLMNASRPVQITIPVKKRPVFAVSVVKPIKVKPVVAKTSAIKPVEIVAAEPKPKRGRPPRAAAPILAVPQEIPKMAAEIVQQSRLLRRSESRPHEPDYGDADEPIAVKLPQGAVRGVVKWFDGRTGKGVLRLAGVSGDVTLDADILARSGIKRLYKDQEIEASVEESRGRIRLVTMSLPGRSSRPLPAKDGEGPSINRAARSVMIEIKRDGNRQTAARAEAEQLFARPNKPKTSRR